MLTYQAPLREFEFLLGEVHDYEALVTSLPGHGDATPDLVHAVLEGANQFTREALLPINLAGDAEHCAWTPRGVRTPNGYRAAYATFREGGWPSLAGDPDF